ncbi:MAG: acyl-CoA dehydrogenase family protein, partial [Rhodoferax sp.]|uniref:acyl-CoA dehydrogenase family protein n=1 Tax=Rhodoferax sp. TaxID=50421 RepID=UPI003BB62094
MSQSAKHLYVNQNDPVEVARQLAAKWRATAVERDRAGGSATAEREELRASGLLSLQLPKEYGGWGADWPTTIEVIREIAKADASLGHLFGYHIATAPMIELVGSTEQTARLYRQLAQNNWWVGNASSENNSHVLEWKVSATPTGDGG